MKTATAGSGMQATQQTGDTRPARGLWRWSVLRAFLMGTWDMGSPLRILRANREALELILQQHKDRDTLLDTLVADMFKTIPHDTTVCRLNRRRRRYCSMPVTEAYLRSQLLRDADGSVISWNLAGCGLTGIPKGFGMLRIKLSLNLSYNNITNLPDTFGDIVIGSDLTMCGNPLRTWPISFSKIRVGRDIIDQYRSEWPNGYVAEQKDLPNLGGSLKVLSEL